MITGQRLAVTSPSSFIEPAINTGQFLKNKTGSLKGLHAPLSPLDQSISISTFGNDLAASNNAMILKYNTVRNSRIASPSNKFGNIHSSYHQQPHQVTSAPGADSKKDHVLTIQLG